MARKKASKKASKKELKKADTFFLNELHEGHVTRSYVRKEREFSQLRFHDLKNFYGMLFRSPPLSAVVSFSPHYDINGKKDGKTLKVDRGYGAFMEFHFSDDGFLIDAGGVIDPETFSTGFKKTSKRKNRRKTK